ncbi:unnamed protein product [Closterium sp. NIES-64]|nr:unnamed protein product [Closterium sp. NIES-64]
MGVWRRCDGCIEGRHGFVVAVTTVESVGTGIVRDDTGYVTFPVRYQCVVFRPFKGEILEGVVTTVNKMGFFAEAGPVQIFVSNHLIPDDMSFTPGDINSYQTEDGTPKDPGGQGEVQVHVKMVGTRVDASEIVSVRVIIDSDEMGASQMDASETVGTGV